MSKTDTFDPTRYLSHKDSFLITLFVAVIVHVIVILGINFSTPQPEIISKAIDITLINTPAPKAPDTAKFLADDNQLGAGENLKKPEPPKQQPPSQDTLQTLTPIKTITPEVRKPKTAPPLLTTQHHAEKKIVTAPKKPVPIKQVEATPDVEQPPQPQFNAETLHQQLTQLGTEIRQSQQSEDDNQIKFVAEVSAHKYVAAQYMKDWESKVERVGNLNYPEEAAKKNFSSTLIMDVTINADGSIHDLIIKRSSGNQALDEAAKKIVRMSAPFAPLPPDLLTELKILGITRVWKFSDESGMTTR